MIKTITGITILLGLQSGLNAQDSQFETASHTLNIRIENLKSNEGKIYIALHDDEGNWLKDAYRDNISEINDCKSSAALYDIPNGVYGLSLFHDKNNNGKLDTGFMGIPKEPYACSNGAKGKFGPPKWNDALFTIDKDNQEIIIRF